MCNINNNNLHSWAISSSYPTLVQKLFTFDENQCLSHKVTKKVCEKITSFILQNCPFENKKDLSNLKKLRKLIPVFVDPSVSSKNPYSNTDAPISLKAQKDLNNLRLILKNTIMQSKERIKDKKHDLDFVEKSFESPKPRVHFSEECKDFRNYSYLGNSTQFTDSDVEKFAEDLMKCEREPSVFKEKMKYFFTKASLRDQDVLAKKILHLFATDRKFCDLVGRAMPTFAIGEYFMAQLFDLWQRDKKLN